MLPPIIGLYYHKIHRVMNLGEGGVAKKLYIYLRKRERARANSGGDNDSHTLEDFFALLPPPSIG
jgi:hypothetical protein